MDINTKESREGNHFNWLMLMIISLASIALGIYRDGIAVLFPFLQRDFNLTRGQIGLYISFLYLTSSLVSVYSGRLADIKGSKWGMTYGVLFVGVMLILHSIAPNFIILLMLAAFAGLGLSINPSAANKGITESFPIKWRSTATGIWSTAFPIGGLLAASILPFFSTLIGWRKTILFPGFLALLCSFLIANFYHTKGSGKEHFKNKTNRISFWKFVIQLTNNIDLMVLSIYGFFLGAAAGTIATHFTLFLFLDYKLSESIAGIGFAVVQFGSILGRPGWGLICDKILRANKRKAFLLIGFVFLLIALIYGLFLQGLNPSLVIIFILAFLAGGSGRGWQGLFFAAIPEIVEEEQVGTAIGLALLFLRAGTLLTPPIFGYIADLRDSYDFSWLLLGLVLFSASVVQYIFYIKTKGKRKVSAKQKKGFNNH